ncbi:hypothetical protein ACFXKC_42095 [Streptomyces sp. NPDC059340]|uniref:hypothetical protein n=1 Tax=Streptomyces sp. NPDC059340 TaxID=3346806 RepID=UPI00369AEF99
MMLRTARRLGGEAVESGNGEQPVTEPGPSRNAVRDKMPGGCFLFEDRKGIPQDLAE